MASAIVLQQHTPTPLGVKVGDTDMYAASLTKLGQVTGSYAECWQQAKAMTNKPVLQWLHGGPENVSE